jgi:hypothetical protein
MEPKKTQKRMKNILIVWLLLPCYTAICQQSFSEYKIPNTGIIKIPDNMEQRENNDNTENRIIFQNKKSINSYSRVIINTKIGEYGDFKQTIPESEIEANNLTLKQNYENSLPNGTVMLKWFKPSNVTINGFSAFKVMYIRQFSTDSPALVTLYTIQNNDRIHYLTVSYTIKDENIWKPLFTKIVNSFKIHNVR